MTATGIESSSVQLPNVPNLKQPVASSLNHACTMLSEVFETSRLAHTASIYQNVFYRESNGCWYPLNDLRDDALATVERQVIRDLWDEVVKTMPSRPFSLK